MGDISRYLANKLLDHSLKKTAFTRPTNIYLALLDGAAVAVDDGSTIPEVSGGSYARKLMNSWDLATGRVTANSTGLAFPEVTVSLGVVSYIALLDTLTAAAGNMLAFGAVTPNRLCDVGATPQILRGDIDISFNANGPSTYLANKLLDHVFHGTAFSQPTTLAVALSTGTILDTTTGTTITEPGDTYTRKAIGGMSAASVQASHNAAAIAFPTAGASWGTVASFALLDALATGHILFHAALTTSRAIIAGNIPEFTANSIVASLT